MRDGREPRESSSVGLLTDPEQIGASVRRSIDTSCMKPCSGSKDWKTLWLISGRNGLAPKVCLGSLTMKVVKRVDEWSQDPENLLVLLQTWQNGDVSQQEPYNGYFEKAMASIKAKTLVLPAKTDLYFP